MQPSIKIYFIFYKSQQKILSFDAVPIQKAPVIVLLSYRPLFRHKTSNKWHRTDITLRSEQNVISKDLTHLHRVSVVATGFCLLLVKIKSVSCLGSHQICNLSDNFSCCHRPEPEPGKQQSGKFTLGAPVCGPRLWRSVTCYNSLLLVVSISFISYPSLKDGSVSYSPSSPLQFKQVVT